MARADPTLPATNSVPEPRESAPRAGKKVLILKILVSASLMALVLSQVNMGNVIGALAQVKVGWLLLALGLNFVGAFLTASRWRLLLAAQGTRTTTFHLMKCWLVACFFNQFLPSTVGGDAFRIYDTWRLGASKASAVAVIGVDRLLGLFSLMMFGVLALFLSSAMLEERAFLSIFVWAAVAGLGLISAWVFFPNAWIEQFVDRVLALFPGAVRRIATRFHEAIGVFRGRTSVLAYGLSLSTLLQFNVIVFYLLIGRSLGVDLSVLDYMLVIPIASIVLLLPFTINGVGLREGVFTLLFGLYGISAGQSVAFAWVAFAMFAVFGSIGGVVYALRRS